MPYAVEFRRSAATELLDIPMSEQRNIRSRVDHLAEEPRPPWARPLSGQRRYWRFRVGRYRVVYDIDDGQRRVIVVRVAPRDDVYDNLP